MLSSFVCLKSLCVGTRRVGISPLAPPGPQFRYNSAVSFHSQTAERLRGLLTWPAWAALVLTLILARLFPAWCVRWQFLPFIIGMVFLGLPHGALDHLAPLRLLHRRLTWRYLVLFVLGYGALVVVYLVFWRFWPGGALVAFLLLSWLHWGQGDAYFLQVFAGQAHPSSAAERLLVWAVRGGLPIVLPVLAFPLIFTQVAEGILGWYGPSGGWVLAGPLRAVGLALFGAILVTYLGRSWRRDRKAFGLDVGETILLLTYFWLVPPILAVGVYFCVWHSARHVGRLTLLDSRPDEPLSRCLARQAIQALPMTLGALALLAGLFVWHGRHHVSAEDFVYLYLSLIAALTFPHFLLVLWMDRQELGQDGRDTVVISGRGDPVREGL